MKYLISILFCLNSLHASAQSEDYNCKVLKEIVKSIDSQRILIQYSKAIAGKYQVIEKNGKYIISPKKYMHKIPKSLSC